MHTAGNSEDSDDFEDGENCCVCGFFRPPVSLTTLIVLNWSHCENISCGHLVHLRDYVPQYKTHHRMMYSIPRCNEEWEPSLYCMIDLRNNYVLLWKSDHNHQRHGRCLCNNWIFLNMEHIFICFKINDVLRCNMIIGCIIVDCIYCYGCSDCIDI